jgi:hypothetical protein
MIITPKTMITHAPASTPSHRMHASMHCSTVQRSQDAQHCIIAPPVTPSHIWRNVLQPSLHRVLSREFCVVLSGLGHCRFGGWSRSSGQL